MTEEEKAKAYDNVVGKLKQFMAQGVDPLITRSDVQDFFPELQESEDEKIINGLSDFLHCTTEKFLFETFGINKEDALAWLEKQAEQKPIETTWKPSEEQIKILDEILNFAANHENPYWNDYIFGTLNNLIRQLKKLKA